MTYPVGMHQQTFTKDGFVTVPNVMSGADCEALIASVGALNSEAAGTRDLLSHEWCKISAARLRHHSDLAQIIPAEFVAVQCTYFEKSVSNNWLVPVHQDLSVPVAERVLNEELRGWSEKEGSLFVQPPVEFLEGLIAVRIHLDDCAVTDGPLQFVPGTHTLGRIDPEAAGQMRQAGPVVSCAVERGGALVMRPLVLHASSKATGTSKRRVLHFLFGPPELPFGLRWQHAA